MAKQEKHTDEYFMKKFSEYSTKGKCQSILDNYLAYGMSQIMEGTTKSKARLEKLDTSAEVNFRLAGKKIKQLSSDELTAYLQYVKEKMLNSMSAANTDKLMLNIKMCYGTILRQLPVDLTSEQHAIKDEIENILESYFIKLDKEM